MSHSDRDQRGRPHSGKRCPESRNGGCVYCHTGDQKPHLRRKQRRAEAEAIAAQQSGSSWADDVEALIDVDHHADEHVYLAGRCLRCNVNWLDAGDDSGLETCAGKDDDAPVFYSTATGEAPVSSHEITT